MKKKRWDSVEIVSFISLTLLAIVIVVPFWNAVVISFETLSAYVKAPFSWLPGEFTWENYASLTKQSGGLLRAYANTIWITVVGTVLGMAVMVTTAYAFSRQFPLKKPLFMIMLFTMYFNGGLVPTYLLVKNMGLLDTHTAVILLSLASTYNVIVMKNGFSSIPTELPEAARIDGANDLEIFWKVMLPLQKPMLATFTLFTAVGFWNNWYWPMLILNSKDKVVLQMFLRSLIQIAAQMANEVGTSLASELTYAKGIQMAAVFLVMLPIMMVYPFLQKYFVKGVLVGGVKM